MRARGARAATAIVLAICLAASGCSGQRTVDADSMTVAFTAAPQNLDFTATPGAAAPQVLMTNVYQGLVRIGQHGNVRPALASSWSISDDRTAYRFHLRRGVTFSSGAPFTARDAKFSIDRVKKWAVPLRHKMDVVKSVRVESAHDVTVRLKRPSNAWLFDMGTAVGAMFSRTGTGDLADHPVGTGPYRVTRWSPGKSVLLTRRSGYWGEKPKLKTVKFKYFSDATAESNALHDGDIDVIGSLQAPDLARSFRDDTKKFQLIDGTTNGEVVLVLNNRKPPFNDRTARRAIMYGIDRKAVVDTAWEGYGTVIGGMVAPTDPYYEDLNGIYPYNRKKAEALVRKAGIDGQRIHFTVPDLPYATAVAEVVREQLREIGLRPRIDEQEFPAVWTDRTFDHHDYQMSVINHAEPRDILTVFGDPDNYIGYRNPRVAKLAARADRGTPAQYRAGMRKVARMITGDAASDFLFSFPNLIAAKAQVRGLEKNAVTNAFDVTRLTWS